LQQLANEGQTVVRGNMMSDEQPGIVGRRILERGEVPNAQPPSRRSIS
jgi:hypothetical protein